MKNYVIMLLCVCLLLSISFAYKWKKTNQLNHFPTGNIAAVAPNGTSLYLVLSFSKSSCTSCMGIIEYLNDLGNPFFVCGIVPDEELANEANLRQVTRAKFKLFPLSDFQGEVPVYSPSLIGVNPKGRVLFILPGAPDQKEYFENFLFSFYSQAQTKGAMDV